MANSSYVSRSQAVSYQTCPRKRWYEYEVPTSNVSLGGVKLAKLDMNLHTGSCYHVGMEALNSGRSVEEAVGQALEAYWPVVKAQGFILESSEDASYVAYEQAAMVEALIRAYGIAILPGNLERFDIVETEKEDLAIFSEGGFDLHFGARLDSLLVEKGTGDIYVQSFKTTKEWGKKSDDSARHDMQGMSETATVDQRLQRWQEILDSPAGEKVKEAITGLGEGMVIEGAMIPWWFIQRWQTGAAPYVMGVKMEFALKGRRSENPKGSGRYVYSNPLIRPWKKADDLKSFGGRAAGYAFKYEFQDELGGNHRLGKGWNSVNIWEDMGVKNWIELLASESIQGFAPGTALTNQFVTPVEYYRNEEDIARWKRQIIAQEQRIATAKTDVGITYNLLAKNPNSSEYFDRLEEKVDALFPMHTRSCDWPTKCVFQPLCFGPRPYLIAPEASGLFQIRTANHPTEEEFNGH